MEREGESVDGPWSLAVQQGVLRCTNARQKLESAIFNAVSLGQWEAAQAHFATLARGEAAGRENARELLKLLVMESSNFWSCSAAIPSPHHLSWLALQAYRSLFPDANEQLPDYVERLVEFRLLLCTAQSITMTSSTSSSSSTSIASTLCCYHTAHVLAIPGTDSEPASTFQSATLSFLYDVLVSRPATGHALIRSLTVPNPAYLINNEALQLLYVEAINECLEAILQLKLPEGIETDSDSQYESDHTSTNANQGRQNMTKECQRLTDLVYDLLSLMDPQPDMSRVSVDKLFVYLLELRHRIGPEKSVSFDASKIYSCLLGRSSPYLLKRLHDAEEYVRIREANGSTSAGEKRVATSAWSMEMLKRTSTPQDWRALFYHTHHDHKHFLECVLDIGLQLIRVSRLDEVSQLLSQPELAPLRPALLLLGWDVYLTEGSGKELTVALWPAQVSLSQPLLYEGCCRLAFQVELVQWCLDKARPHLISSSHPPPPTSTHQHSHRAGDMFKGLETHSVLYILHHYTPLAALDHLEVVDILKHRPRVPSLSMAITPPPQFSTGVTPLKPPHESETSPGSSVFNTPQRLPSQQHGKLKPEQERDIAIFRSFRALKLVLDALWAAVQIENGIYPTFPGDGDEEEEEEGGEEEEEEGKEGERKKEEESKTTKEDAVRKSQAPAARKLDFGEGGVPELEADGDTNEHAGRGEDALLGLAPSLQEQVYSRLVLDKLQDAKICISLLYPLNYRLEILENIFSLLFLTSEDVRALRQGEGGKQASVTAAKLKKGSSSSPTEGVSQAPPLFQSDGEFSATLSSMALIRSKHGFLINEKVSSDLLSVLQDSMFEMRAARFVLTQPVEVGGTATLQPDAIRSSVSPSSVQQRSAKLEQYINEARWRLQLISSKHGIVANQDSGRGGVKVKGSWAEFSSSADSGSEISESDTDTEENQEREQRKKQSRKTSAITDSQEVKRSDSHQSQHAVPDYEVMPPHVSSGRPPSIMSKSTYTGKLSPSFNPPANGGYLGSTKAPTLQFTRSLTIPSTTSSLAKPPRLSPSLKLGTRRSLRQKSPREAVEGGGSGHPPQGSPAPAAAPLSWSSEHPLGEVDSGEFADVEDKSPSDHKRKKRLRSRSLQAAKKRRMKVTERMESGGRGHGSVVSQMLASPGSLLRMCLKHSNYSRAYEVLKMFEMEGQFGEAFVHFSEKYESVSRELAEHSRNSTPKHSPSLTPQDPSTQPQATPKSSGGLTSLTASLSRPGLTRALSLTSSVSPNPNTHLQLAIANATNSSSVLESLHHLLAPSSLHRMLLSGDDQLERAAQDSATLQVLIDHVPALVMLDIVCSTRVEGQVAKRIIELASGQCQTVLESLPIHTRSPGKRLTPSRKWNTHHDVHLPGPFSLLLLLSEVSGYFTNPSLHLSPPPHGHHHPPPYHSPHSLFSVFSRQLRTAAIVSCKAFVESYHNARDRLSKLLEQDTLVKGDIIAALAQPGLGMEESQRTLSHHRQMLNSLFEELMRVLAGNPRAPTVLPGSPKERGLMRRSSLLMSPTHTLADESGVVNTKFVLQFSRYLSQLMDLLLKCLSPASNSLSEASLLLSILQESPSRLLGRLVFEVGVAPQRLEELMHSFQHMHMMEVLVKCCCPQLPAQTQAVIPRALPPPAAVVALNDGESAGPLGDLCVFSEKQLTKLLTLLRDNMTPAGGQDGTVSTEDLRSVYNSPQMKELLSRTALLASADLRTLVTTPELTCFYANVANFLYAHCVMVCVAGEHGEEEGVSVLHGSRVSLAELQRSAVFQVGVFSRLGYRVGQLGLVSCHDLHYSILRRGLSTPHLTRDTPLHSRIAPLKPNPWAQFSPTSPDPRLLYVVHSGPVSSPLPCPLHPDDLSSSLTTAERRYLSSSVQIDVAAKEVIVPLWLFTHRDDFGKPVWNDRHGNSSLHYLSDLSLLSYVQTHIGREQSELLQPLVVACETAMARKLPLPVRVLAKKDVQEFGYNFTSVPEGHHHSTSSGGGGVTGSSGRQSPRSSPKVLRKRLSRPRGSQTDIPEATVSQTQTVVGYSFTAEILTFVSGKSPLLAALIHLLCPPPPSPPPSSSSSVATPGRKTGKTGLEEDSATGVGSGGVGSVPTELSEGEREQSGKKVSMFGLRGRGKTQLSRRTSYDHHTPLVPTLSSSWQRELDDILVQFVTLGPMQQFLQARIANFNSVLPWDPPTRTPGKRGRSSSSSALLEPATTLRGIALLPSRGTELGIACSYTLHRLLETGRVQDAVRFLSSEPTACHRGRMHLLSDVALASAFVQSYSEILALGQSGERARDILSSVSPLTLLSRLSDPEMAARLALPSLHNWPVDMCRDILSFCSHHLSPSSLLLPPVQEKLERITIYASIMDKCKSLLFSRTGRERERREGESEQKSWKCWSDLASDSENRPSYVLEVLLAEKAFDLARKWAVVHSLKQRITQQIEVDYLSALLEGQSPDPMSAHRVLDSLVGDLLRLHVCESVLQQSTQHAAGGSVGNLETVIFILHYMLSKLGKCLKETKHTEYSNKLLGAKALLCLPREERSEYRSLMGHATLIVEQLLINKKMDLAGAVVKVLRCDEHIESLSLSDIPQLDHTPVALPKNDADDPFTTLFMFYASKTLDFPEPVLTSSTSQPFSNTTTASSTRPTSPGHPSYPHTVPLSPGEPHTFTEPPSRMSYTHRRKRSSMTPMSPTPMHYTDSAHHYEPPAVPPPREKWEPDANATHCQVCHNVYFGMFNRRHHCRRCGRVVCARCSPFVSQVEGYSDRLQRVCKDCHTFEQSTTIEDGAAYSSDYPSYLSSAFPALSPSPLLQWRLMPNDPTYNNNIRSDFYYEESPSSALCLTLVDLISSRRAAAGYLLDCCHTVSLQLVPDTHGRVNQEVDHYFVIGLIQNLLWNAKLRFAEASDSSGVELCDTYLSRVDLLRQLVSSRSHIIPSIQELTKPELARRVRDRLIQEDQFEPAMEVSTKCQLDTSAVWSAWGMACLRCGEFPRARDKFKHCFQMSSQRGSGVAVGRRGSIVGVACMQLLERIVEQIEQSPLAITTRNTQHADDWSSVMVGCMSLNDKHSEDCDLDTHRFSECLHYVNSYGGPSATVTFLVRHNCWTDACKFILDEKCTVEVFVEQVWVPALKAGVIDNAQDIMKALDHSLAQWEPYLTAVCRFFSQRSLYHTLYQTQLYMRDFIRAGMTCIKFFIGFSGRNTTIRDLYSRMHYLTTAQRHFQSALDAKQRAREHRPSAGGRGRSHHRSSDDYQPMAASTKSMSVADLHSHISTITLQMKVTEFLYQCAEATGTLRTPLTTSGEVGGANSSGGGARKPPQPITLFSSGHTRAEVAVQLMLSSQDIVEGFDIAQGIMQTYHLPPTNILCEVSRGLAGVQHYGDVRLLLECMKKSSFASDSLNDDIIMAAIKVLAGQTRETKQVEKLVQLLTSERSKIKALVQCGKLKNAYLTAIKSRHVDEVRNISQIAEKAGQLAVRDICEKWLQGNTSSSARGRYQ